MTKIFHQTGHNYKWNLDSHVKDSVGSGMIISPINISARKLAGIPSALIQNSLFDPQLYLPHDQKGDIGSYEYFPSTISPQWQSADYESVAAEAAEKCLALQESKFFKYRIIPARYAKDITSSYYKLAEDSLINPFISAWSKSSKSPLLLTVIVKRIQVIDSISRNELLNWITGIPEITGVYILFEPDQDAKQIKDSEYLCGCLQIVSSLIGTGLEAHVGYANTEILLFSAVGATSVTVGSYENLRRFKPSRFEDKKRGGNSPTPRIYMSQLLQWIEYGYIGALVRLYKDWINIQDYTPYYPKMFTSSYKWHATKEDPYKHYFVVMDRQINLLNKSDDPLETISEWTKESMNRFSDMRDAGVFMDSESDGSHLPHWLNAISLFKQK